MIIRNRKTGETRNIDPSQAGQYGIQSQQSNPLDFLGKAWQGVQDFRQNVSNLTQQGVSKEAQLLGQKPPTPEQYQNLQNTISSVTGSSLGGDTALGKIAPTIGSKLKLLTKGGVNKAIESSVTKAGEKGATDVWGDFVTEVKQEVQKRLGSSKNYQDLVNSRLTPETPPMSGITQPTARVPLEKGYSPEFTTQSGLRGPETSTLENVPYGGPGQTGNVNPLIQPQKLLDLRRQASNRLPSGIFQKFQGKSPVNQVDEIIRDVASKRLKDVAPGVKGYDRLYSLYSKLGGSPLKWAGRLGTNALLGNIPGVPKEAKGPAQDVAFGLLEGILSGGRL